MRSRLDQVAEHAGVSRATVSRVLNDKPGVAESTRAAVLAAVNALGYERPTMLRGHRLRLVGVVVPDLRNPVFPAFTEVIGGALTQRELTPVICVTQSGGMSEAATVDMLLAINASGFVFVSGLHAVEKQDLDHYRRIRDHGLPMVAVNGTVDELSLTTVSTDDLAAVELAVGHLSTLGHQRIGLAISDDEHVPGHRKFAAFERLMRERHGVTGNALLVERSMYSIEGGFAAGGRLLERGATAVICASDVMALGVVRAAHRLGLDVPRDVSVIGYDDSTFMSAVSPPITTIRQPVESLGSAAVGLLGSQLTGAKDRGEEILFEPELVVRGSTAIAPDRRIATA
ncbi:LacI family DNA-binding transcriptional regulator [Streptomyces sp.]|uniref:LacI family DNA-binding transcriptional regulator n=1 Tax=Streptomyces sp. TaxID=1931 RepID=UPI002F408D5D